MPPRGRERPSNSPVLTPNPEPLLPPGGSSSAGAHRGGGEVEMVYLSGRVPRELRAQLQHQAIREGRPLVALLQDAVTAYLESHDTRGT